MAIHKAIKKRVTEDWLNAFPELSAFEQNKLYKIVGCFVIGIELIKLPYADEYRPHFVIYPLWRTNAEQSLDGTILMKQLFNKKGLQFDIPFETHSKYFLDAIECFNKQITVSLNSDLPLKSLFDFVDIQFSEFLVKSNSANQAMLFELKFYAALFTGNNLQCHNVQNQILKTSEDWNMQMFERWYGNFAAWFKGLQDKVACPEEFLKQIEKNKHNEKISKLKSSALRP